MRSVTVAALVCAAAISAASPAAAAVTIGQVAPPEGVATNCPGIATDVLQPSVTGGAHLYVAKQAGTITSWSTRAAAGPDQSYTLKVFRRTTDPDIFRVIGHSGPHTLGSGLNTFPASVPVSSGDLLGFNVNGAANACTFDVPGDSVLVRTGNLADGASGTFTPLADSRLNLSAVLVPTNGFSFGAVTRDRRTGTATLEIQLSNPGAVTLSGKGLKKTGRRTKTVAVASTVRFGVAAGGGRKKKLNRKGEVSVRLAATFTPTGGDPATQTIQLKLKKKRA
ncbi:MAG TPA: hypothetical protein VFT14_05110 [Solirubrobacterales bacterium]|nr:hypothetical protein [Solirubrobacterales bacterium]